MVLLFPALHIGPPFSVPAFPGHPFLADPVRSVMQAAFGLTANNMDNEKKKDYSLRWLKEHS